MLLDFTSKGARNERVHFSFNANHTQPQNSDFETHKMIEYLQDYLGYFPIYDRNIFFDIGYANMVSRSAKEASQFKITVTKLSAFEILSRHAVTVAPYVLLISLFFLFAKYFTLDMIPGVKGIMEGSRPKSMKTKRA